MSVWFFRFVQSYFFWQHPGFYALKLNYCTFASNRNFMKRILVAAIIVLLCLEGFSQEVNESTRKKFSTVFDVYTDIWMNVPDSIDNRLINQGINFAGLYDYRIGKSNFSFAFGAGVSCQNFYSDGMVEVDSLGVTQLRPFSSLYPDESYKRTKITATYLDIPLEFRLRTKKEIRASLGFKFGFLLESHTKFKGDDILDTGYSDQVIYKVKDVANIENFRYGVTARFGWKFINLTGFYSLTNLFEKDKGPEMYPISIGISLMPF